MELNKNEYWKNEKRALQKIFYNSPIGTAIATIDGKIIASSRTFSQIIGYSEAELIKINVKQLYFNPEDRGILEQSIAENGTIVNFQTRLIRKDGEAIDVVLTVSNINIDGKNYLQSTCVDISEINEAEKRILEIEERFRILAETSPMAIMMYQDNKWIYANPAAERISGYSMAELRKMEFWKIVAPEFREIVRFRGQEREKGLKSETGYEFKIVTRSGEERWVFLNGDTIRIGDKYTGIITVLDITKRKETEENLRENELRLNYHMRSSPLAVIECDSHGTVMRWSGRAQSTFGWREEEALGKNIGDLNMLPDEELPIVEKALTEIYSGEADYGISVNRNRRKDGQVIFCEWYNSALREQNGELKSILSLVLDVTASKETENCLKEREENFSDLLNNSPDGIVLADSMGRHIFANQRLCEITGYDLNELMEISIKDITPEEELKKYTKMYKKRLNGEMVPHSYERSLVCKNGHRIPVEMRTTTTVWKGEKCALAFITDISRRKQIEKEKNELREQLQQSQKIEAVGELAGGIAHDFNNILTIINGYSDLALNSMSENDMFFENFSQIFSAGQKAAELTRQLLAFSRKQVLKPRVLEMKDLLLDLQKMLKRIIGEQTDLKLELEPDLLQLNADPSQIEQVIVNLVINARDAFDSKGKIVISCINRCFEKQAFFKTGLLLPGNYLQISVEDNGCGMSAETLEHIFDPFFTTKAVGRGTGLGLSVAYGIVMQHEGIIDVSSTPGKGSAFKVFLPAINRSQIDQANCNSAAITLNGSNWNILFVEDDKDVRGVGIRFLKKYGFAVAGASNADEAQDIFEKENGVFDLLISDVILSGRSGFDLARALITLKPELKVILNSGYAAEKINFLEIQNKGIEFLEKPYSLHDLVQRVKKVLEK